MPGSFEGRVALVTGAGSSGPGVGNGKAIALELARAGASVMALDRSPAAAEETRELIEREGGACAVVVADVTREPEVVEAVSRCVERFGKLDVLVNNVGIVEVGHPTEIDEAAWDKLMNVNLKSVFLTCKAAIPLMEQAGRGAIVNVSSIGAIRYLGYPSPHYAASKAAVSRLTKDIAVAYAKRGIRANAVLPGYIDTPMIVEPLQNAYGPGGVEEMRRKRSEMVPLGRMGTAWDVAAAVLFLASDAAAYITGAELVVDGGLTCKFG